MSEHHHRSAHYIAEHLLAKWRNNQWNNSFVSSNVTKAHSPSGFPSPDADFQDKSLNTKISIEFKPETISLETFWFIQHTESLVTGKIILTQIKC
jgi:hypothetical protein